MSFISIDNPGRGHCGFYAFAVGLLHLMSMDEASTVYGTWLKLDPSAQATLDAFRQEFQQATAGDSAPEQRFARLCAKNHYAFLEPLKNSIKIILKSHRLKQLNQRITNEDIWLSDRHKCLLYEHFVELVENNYPFLPYNIFASSVFLKDLANKILHIINQEPDSRLRHCKLKVLSKQAFQEYQDEFKVCIEHKYSPTVSWWASEEDLLDLAICFEQNVNFTNAPLNSPFPSIYLENISNVHWKTRVYFAHRQPDVYLEQARSRERILEDIRSKITTYANFETKLMELQVLFSHYEAQEPSVARAAALMTSIKTQFSDILFPPGPVPREDLALLNEYLQQSKQQLLQALTLVRRYRDLTERVAAVQLEEAPDQATLKALNIRREVLIEYIELLKSPYQGNSEAFQEYYLSCLERRRNIALIESSFNGPDLDELQLSIQENDIDIKELTAVLYQKLSDDLTKSHDLPSLRLKPDLSSPQLFFSPSPSPQHLRLAQAKNNQASHFLYASVFGVGLGALVLNAIPGVLSAVTLATGLSAVAANLVFILLAVYLVNVLVLIHQIYQEAQIQKYAPGIQGI